jgi:hypothetical protein
VLVLIGLFFLLRHDSPAPDSDASEDAMMSGSAADRPQEKTFDLTIERGAMAPDEIIVDEGDKVNLQIISDRPLEFHLHGYDLEKEMEPNEPEQLLFDATITGRFEIENEQTREELGVFLVQPR